MSIRIRLISLVSLFCRTRNKTHPAIISDGTRSVPRNNAASNWATCENASLPNSSFLKQQNIQRKRRSHKLESFLCNADSVGPLSLLSFPFLYFVEPRGSNTMARPKIINAKWTQLKITIADLN